MNATCVSRVVNVDQTSLSGAKIKGRWYEFVVLSSSGRSSVLLRVEEQLGCIWIFTIKRKLLNTVFHDMLVMSLP